MSETIYDSNPHLQALIYEVQAAETAALRANAMCQHAVRQWEAERNDLTRQLDNMREQIDAHVDAMYKASSLAGKVIADIVSLLAPDVLQSLYVSEQPDLRAAYGLWQRYYGSNQEKP